MSFSAKPKVTFFFPSGPFFLQGWSKVNHECYPSEKNSWEIEIERTHWELVRADLSLKKPKVIQKVQAKQQFGSRLKGQSRSHNSPHSRVLG